MKSPRGFLAHTDFLEGASRKWCLYVPPFWDGVAFLPTILYLHGRGESGTDGLRQLLIGLPAAIVNRAEDWPFLVICPQKAHQDEEWFDQQGWLSEVLRQTEETYPVDTSRRYITGLSQGGRGTFRLAGRLPWKFAAAAPVCGWVDPAEAVESLRGVPTWAIHGLADETVPAAGSIDAISALKGAGESPEITLLEGVGHNSWDFAYREAGLAAWLLRHQRPQYSPQ